MDKKTVHKIKTVQPFFNDIKEGRKNFELRLNDRNYEVGDSLIMEEWTGTRYTGDKIERQIKYVLENCTEFGLMQGYCIINW